MMGSSLIQLLFECVLKPCCICQGAPTLEFQTLDLVVVETEKMHIPVPFKAVPSPKITWHKDGKELKADERLGFRSGPPLLLFYISSGAQAVH